MAERAMSLLGQAERENAADPQVHLQLGYLDQLSGNPNAARQEYREVLATDPYETSALGNLAIAYATQGNTAAALDLLTRAVTADGSQTATALNLAFIECRLGKLDQARQTLQTLSRFNPDNPLLREFLNSGRYAGQSCRLEPESTTHATR